MHHFQENHFELLPDRLKHFCKNLLQNPALFWLKTKWLFLSSSFDLWPDRHFTTGFLKWAKKKKERSFSCFGLNKMFVQTFARHPAESHKPVLKVKLYRTMLFCGNVSNMNSGVSAAASSQWSKRKIPSETKNLYNFIFLTPSIPWVCQSHQLFTMKPTPPLALFLCTI